MNTDETKVRFCRERSSIFVLALRPLREETAALEEACACACACASCILCVVHLVHVDGHVHVHVHGHVFEETLEGGDL